MHHRQTPFERPTSVEVMAAILREDPAELPESVSPGAASDRLALPRKGSRPSLPFGARPGVRAAHRQRLARRALSGTVPAIHESRASKVDLGRGRRAFLAALLLALAMIHVF